MATLGDMVRANLERDIDRALEEVTARIADLAKAQTKLDNLVATLSLHNSLDTGAPRTTVEVTCTECWRVFDLRDEQDNHEWHYGHDCEADHQEES